MKTQTSLTSFIQDSDSINLRNDKIAAKVTHLMQEQAN